MSTKIESTIQTLFTRATTEDARDDHKLDDLLSTQVLDKFEHSAKAKTKRCAPTWSDALAPARNASHARRCRGHNAMLNQASSSERLGNGNLTIRSSGCFLASMTMASNILDQGDRNLTEANARVRARRGFSESLLRAPVAAQALGLNLEHRSTVAQGGMRRALRALRNGDTFAAAVDYRAGSGASAYSDADHWVLVCDETNSGDLIAHDPAGGHEITFSPDRNGTYRARSGSKDYEIVEVAVLTA